MAQVPNNSESLSKHLRSKQTKISEIVDLVKNDYNGIYFPNGNLFVFELIVDRFNEQKNNTFVLSEQSWKLFNQLWDTIHQNYELKYLIKLFKKLKLYQILITIKSSFQENTALAEEIDIFLNKLKQASLSIDVPQPELCFKLICNLIEGEDLVKVQSSIIEKLIVLMDFDSKADQSRFLQYLLYKSPSSLLDLVQLNDPNVDAIIKKYVLNQDILDDKEHISKLLAKTIKSASSKNHKSLTRLFRMVIKNRPVLTESIFEQISSISTDIVPDLLSSLSQLTKKKLISEDILNKIMLDTINSDDSKIQWPLIKDTLKINIELGIKNCELIMQKLQDCHNDETQQLQVWEQLIQCYVSAREFHIFISDVLLPFYQKTPNSKLLNNLKYTTVISPFVSNLSTTQLLSIINQLLDTPQVLLLVIKGLNNPVSLQYVKDNQDLKTVLRDLIFSIFDFSADTTRDTTNWELTFHVMELYYSCFDFEQDSEDWKDKYEGLIKNYRGKNHQKTGDDYYYYFTLFKLRELVDIPNEYIVDDFMESLKNGKLGNEEELYNELFTRWSSLVNAVFDKKNLKYFISKLVDEYPTTLINVLSSNDSSNNDFFEEEEIMYELVFFLSDSIIAKKNFDHTKYITLIPIQCWNKNIRVALIDALFENIQDLSEFESIVYLIKEYPTFKSLIETDFTKLLSTLKYDQKIFENVWGNHLVRWKESSDFLKSSLKHLSKKIAKNEVNQIASLIVVLAEHSVNEPKFIKELDKLLNITINHCYQNVQTDIWSVTALYKILSTKDFPAKQDFIDSNVKNLFQNGSKNNLTLAFQNCGVDNQERVCAIFSLFTTTLETKEEILAGLAHYLVLQGNGVGPSSLRTFIETKVSSSKDVFNYVFQYIAINVDQTGDYQTRILDIYQTLLEAIPSKDESLITSFTHSIGKLIELADQPDVIERILPILDSIKNLLTTQQWIFSQYSIEMLFPLCCKLISKSQDHFEQCIESTTQLLSSVLNFHQFRLTSRHHLINTTICFYLDILSFSPENSVQAAHHIGRLIINYCEPSKPNNSGSTTSELLHSKISLLKQNLRRSIGPVLLKYIRICVNNNQNTFTNSVRQELVRSIYSIFDLLSQDELVTVNASLDYSGKTYFKKIYEDYKINGKWKED